MLKVVLLVIEDVIFGQIIDMSEGIRGRIKGFIASNGFAIKSSNCPHLLENTLFIGGADKSRDNDIICYHYDDHSHAIRIANKITLAIKEFTKNEHSVMLITENDIFNTVDTNGTLKLNMLKWERLLIVKNIDIAERDRGKKDILYKNIEIKSINHPQLTPNVLYVRGFFTKQDNNVLYYCFETTSKLKEYVDNITVAVKMWNNSTENTVQFYDFIPVF